MNIYWGIGFIIVWLMIFEYMILDFYYFSKMNNLMKKHSEEYNELFLKMAQFINDNPDKVKVSVVKRIRCPVCGYPMPVIKETDDQYQCYCADCRMDRYVDKRRLKDE